MDPIVSHYRIIEKAGEGGMGVVYRAHDDRLNRDVALKFLPAEFQADKPARDRLTREARTASALNHPNICTIYDVGEANGQIYIVMEFVKGRPLADQIRDGGLPAETVIRYGEQIAGALSHAHEHGVVHRDLKSSNIMITPEGRIKVLDFGLAKKMAISDVGSQTGTLDSQSQGGPLVGTLHYIAPEVLRGESADARSDIWALGVVLYEMAAGQRPFGGKTSYDLSSAILHKSPLPMRVTVTPGLRAVLDHCLAKEPGERYQRASEARAALDALRTHSAIPVVSADVAAIDASRSRRRWLMAAACFLGLLLLAFVTWKYVKKRQHIPAGLIQSLAVLPLVNLSGDAQQDYFADGMTDALITDLSQIKALRVISRSSVEHYKGTRLSVAQIAKELHVDAVVEGSVLRSHDRVRISAELVRGETQQNLWAQSYDRPFSDVLSLQNDVARDIVNEIQVQITQQEQARLTRDRPAVLPAAYDAYLQGRYFASKRTGEALTESIADFQQAIRLDPSYAPAYAGLAGALAISADYKDIPPPQVLQQAEAAAEKALQLDDNLAEAHAALGLIRYSNLEWPGVLPEYQRAIDLNPSDADAHHWNALALAGVGKGDEAIAEITLARVLDPHSLIINANVAWCYYLAGKYDDAIEQAHNTLQLDPTFPVAHGYLAQAYVEKGEYDKAIEELRNAISLSDGETAYKAELGNALAVAGKNKEAREILKDLLALSSKQYVSAYGVALVYVGLGEKDPAFEWLNKAYDQRTVRLMSINAHPRFSSLRSDPRFRALVARMGL